MNVHILYGFTLAPVVYTLNRERYQKVKFYLPEIEWNLVLLRNSLALEQYSILFINVSTWLGYRKWLGHYPIQRRVETALSG